ncbi:hypothetical protein [Cohnella hongkongensis]|uniref:Uncharacterized protein n=1 Tax=Cohnella hongkongensis TaxID=178337 RepID=A0ABV9FI28_9BACL
MTERSLMAYFKTPWEAERAVDRLRALRLIEHSIDRFDGYPGEGVQHRDKIENPLSADFPGIGYLTLGGDFNPDSGVLAAASVSASGYSSGSDDNRVNGWDILLTAIVEEDDYDRALQIVQDSGAL